jgi:hypothetical protein
MSITRKPMTLEEVRQAIGHERPAWAQSLQSHGQLVILVRANRNGGSNDSVLVASATEPEPGYWWVSASSLTRRADLDNSPEPKWLQRARASSRPPAILWDILNPSYSSRALEGGAR